MRNLVIVTILFGMILFSSCATVTTVIKPTETPVPEASPIPPTKVPECDNIDLTCRPCSEHFGLCENENLQFGGWDGINREILWGDKTGECINNECEYDNCKLEVETKRNDEKCNRGTVDIDRDGVMDYDLDGGDNYDHDTSTPPGCLVYQENADPNLIGVQIDKDCESKCMAVPDFNGGADGALNVHMIFVPCNFYGPFQGEKFPEKLSYPQGVFERIIFNFGEGIKKQAPFNSNFNNFKISYIWPYVTDTEAAPNYCGVYEESHKKAYPCMENEENTIIVEMHYGIGTNPKIDTSCSPRYCQIRIGANDYINDENEALLHELGHGFKLGHTYQTSFYHDEEYTYSFTDGPEGLNLVRRDTPATDEEKVSYSRWYNDFYYPDIPYSDAANIIDPSIDIPCPVWDKDILFSDEYSRWADSSSTLGCLSDYFTLVNFFRPIRQKTHYDIMAYDQRVSNPGYNPVARKLINDALTMGYGKYLSLSYPHRCSEIDDAFLSTFDSAQEISAETVRGNCLVRECGFIDTSLPPDSSYIGRLSLGASSNKEACCNQITNDEAKRADCLS